MEFGFNSLFPSFASVPILAGLRFFLQKVTKKTKVYGIWFQFFVSFVCFCSDAFLIKTILSPGSEFFLFFAGFAEKVLDDVQAFVAEHV